ncbi:two-component system sensor histidine kinase DegS [Lachnotalea glycerini]|uniref:Oxygen sensor histidine kinase NreB n=1 Tax=Lachnotalea glycerini TaxID=1763509 RepID=A0A255I757_9FIRM|nr:sensor histidine kinase [Lachnotalea glycerini]PXV85330.1 two-component system sensor histidine kinase DegS [Lachnotalea glycerini]RDY30217.1 sensor histidine kinase [Lachnotalea glycerini]
MIKNIKEENSELECFKELNDFINKICNETLIEKDELLLSYNKNSKTINEIESKILSLQNDISCDQNIFNPCYSNKEKEINLNYLISEKTRIIELNNKIQKKIDTINKNSSEMDVIINKIKNKSYQEYLSNCKDNGKFKIEILRSQELERKRIARDIHDTVIQKLTNLIHKSEFTLKVMDIDSIRAKLELMTISNNLRDVIDEMRDIIYNLRPMAFDDIGIDVIIERELSKLKENGIDVKYEVEGEYGNIDQVVSLTLIRIIQEACNNVLKHSKCTVLCVKILYTKNSIEVIIKDNGVGFEISNNCGIVYESKSGFGLSMMRERVYLLSGKINFKSSANEGTQICFKVPKSFREEVKNAN